MSSMLVRQIQKDQISAKDKGAKGDGITSDSAAFALTEALPTSESTVNIPTGIYLSGLASASKNYEGSGAVKLTSGRNVPGKTSEQLMPRYLDAKHKANAQAFSGPRNLVFIGDSISFAYGVYEEQSYASLIVDMLNRRGPGIQCNNAAGATELLRGTPAGSVYNGTKGPVKTSVIIEAGSTMTFSVKDADYFGFWYQRSPTAGHLQVAVNGTLVNNFDMSGASANDVLAQGVFKRVAGSATVVATATGASVELTGVLFTHQLANGQLAVVNQSASGYATSDYTTAPVIAAIGAQTPYKGGTLPLYVIALGTNDIYNPGKAVASTVFKSNLDTICQGVRSFGIPVLTVPLRAVETTYAPILEPFENYRNAIYEVARKYGYFVIDLSKYDIASAGGYQADGLHPNDEGHRSLAAIFLDELGLMGSVQDGQSGDLTLLNGFSATGGNYTIPAYDITAWGCVNLCGLLTTNAAEKNTTMFVLPVEARPTKTRLLSVGGLNGAVGASVTLQITADGQVVMYDYSTAALTHVSLEAASFMTQR